jgi:hypothetical protein
MHTMNTSPVIVGVTGQGHGENWHGLKNQYSMQCEARQKSSGSLINCLQILLRRAIESGKTTSFGTDESYDSPC